MVYIPNIPQPTDNLSTSQGQILGNFGALDTVYGADHYKFSDATAQATMHRHVTLPVQLAFPAPGAGVSSIYAKAASSGETVAYIRKDASAVDFPIMPVRAMGLVQVGIANSGFNLSWTARVGGINTFTFPQPMADTNFIVIVTPRINAYNIQGICGVVDGSVSVNGFSVNSGTSVTWLNVSVMKY